MTAHLTNSQLAEACEFASRHMGDVRPKLRVSEEGEYRRRLVEAAKRFRETDEPHFLATSPGQERGA